MKTVCVTICKDAMFRNIIGTDFWNLYKKQVDTRVVFIVEKGKAGYYEELLAEEKNIVIVELAPQEITTAQRLLIFFLKVGIKTESVRYYVRRAQTDGHIGFVSASVKMSLSRILGDSLVYKRLLRWCFSKTKCTQTVSEIFDTYKPDLVFTTSLIDFPFDGVIATESKRRGVRVIGMTRSWDNLTSHGLLASVPDRFIFQNIFLQKMAARHQDIPECELNSVIGLPHYDLYKNPGDLLEEKSVFFKRAGLDENKKFIFYAAADMHRGEQAFIKIFEEILSSDLLDEPSQMIYRIHPSSLIDRTQIPVMNNVLVNDNFRDRQSGVVTEFDTKHYINCLYHADVVIQAGSTAAIDAIVCGKPVISLNYDGGMELPYWLRSNRMYDQFTHYINLVNTGGTMLVHSDDELVAGINEYFKNPSKNIEGRERLLELLVEPFDGESTRRLTRIIVEEINALT